MSYLLKSIVCFGLVYCLQSGTDTEKPSSKKQIEKKLEYILPVKRKDVYKIIKKGAKQSKQLKRPLVLVNDIITDILKGNYSKADAERDLRFLLGYRLFPYYNLQFEIGNIIENMDKSKKEEIRSGYIKYNPDVLDTNFRKDYSALLKTEEKLSPEILQEIYAITEARLTLAREYMKRTEHVSSALGIRETKKKLVVHENSTLMLMSPQHRDRRSTFIARFWIKKVIVHLEAVKYLVQILLDQKAISQKVVFPRFEINDPRFNPNDKKMMKARKKTIRSTFDAIDYFHFPLGFVVPCERNSITYPDQMGDSIVFFRFVATKDLLPENVSDVFSQGNFLL